MFLILSREFLSKNKTISTLFIGFQEHWLAMDDATIRWHIHKIRHKAYDRESTLFPQMPPSAASSASLFYRQITRQAIRVTRSLLAGYLFFSLLFKTRKKEYVLQNHGHVILYDVHVISPVMCTHICYYYCVPAVLLRRPGKMLRTAAADARSTAPAHPLPFKEIAVFFIFTLYLSLFS